VLAVLALIVSYKLLEVPGRIFIRSRFASNKRSKQLVNLGHIVVDSIRTGAVTSAADYVPGFAASQRSMGMNHTFELLLSQISSLFKSAIACSRERGNFTGIPRSLLK
jgi:hypothetical protein